MLSSDTFIAAPENTYALVVAIETYAIDNYNLKGPVKDALDFIRWLLSHKVPADNITFIASPLPPSKGSLQIFANQWNIKICYDATSSNIYNIIAHELPRKSGDLLWIFWGGHGFVADDSKRSLMFADARQNDCLSLDFDSFRGSLHGSLYKGFNRQIIIIDACADLVDGPKPVTIQIPRRNYLTSHRQLTWFACQEGQKAWNDESGEGGEFSQVVLKALAEAPPAPFPPDMLELEAIVRKEFEERLKEKRGTQLPKFSLELIPWQGPQLWWPRYEHAEMPSVSEPTKPPVGKPAQKPSRIAGFRRWLSIAIGGCLLAIPHGREVEIEYPSSENNAYILESILHDINNMQQDKRSSMRYFSLYHLKVDGVPDSELHQHRDALFKAINHLSSKPEIIKPMPIDSTETIYRIDISKFGWNDRPLGRFVTEMRSPKKTNESDGNKSSLCLEPRLIEASRVNLFDLALLEYPYGVIDRNSRTFQRLSIEFLALARQVRPIPYIRADWFVSVATRSPLYEDFLGLPDALSELEKQLGVDVNSTSVTTRIKKTGPLLSGHSGRDRLVERYPARFGAYWKSVDLDSEIPDGHPNHLNPRDQQVIFNLPNGLQGYFLANAEGKRLDALAGGALIDPYSTDPDNPVVRNGLACMRCHDAGIKKFSIAEVSKGIKKDVQSKQEHYSIPSRHADQQALDYWIDKDNALIQKSLGINNGGETLISVSQRFLNTPLTVSEIAAELGFHNTLELRTLLAEMRSQEVNAPPGRINVVNRDEWEDLFPHFIHRLNIGQPIPLVDSLAKIAPEPTQQNNILRIYTNKPDNVFIPNDPDGLIVHVKNLSHKTMYIEAIMVGAEGDVCQLPFPNQLPSGEEYSFPPEPQGQFVWRGLAIGPRLGKDCIFVYASDAAFPGGLLLGRYAGEGPNRFVHAIFNDSQPNENAVSGFDLNRLSRYTIQVETR